MRPKAAHTSFRQGTPVWVQLRSGQQFRDVFQETKGKTVLLRQHGRVSKRALRAMSIYRAA